MLSEGSISLSKIKINRGTGKYAMTMYVYSLNYLHYLIKNIYSQFTETKIYPYLNILFTHHKGEEITKYHFKTKTNHYLQLYIT
jgi:hypothetical protein